MQKTHILLVQSVFTLLLVLPVIALPHRISSGHLRTTVSALSRPTDGFGTYESCDPHLASICDARLNAIAAGGFSEVMNYAAFSSDTTISDVIAYAAFAHLIGLKVIWPLGDFVYSKNDAADVLSQYPTLVDSINSSGLCSYSVRTNYWLVACVTIVTSGQSGTWGYYIGDELPASEEPSVRHVVDAILDWNRTAPRMFMAAGIGPRMDASEVDAYGRFYDDGVYATADANVIAQDYYPIGTPEQKSAAAITGQIAGSLQSFANKYHTSYGMALQAHSLAEYKALYPWCKTVEVCPYPTAPQELSMLTAVLAQGQPRIVMWYSYFDLLDSGNYTQLWNDLTQVVGAVPDSYVVEAPTPPSGALPFACRHQSVASCNG